MLLVLVDAVILMALLNSFGNEDFGIWTAVGVSLVTSIAASLLAFGLASLIGMAGVIVAVLIVAAGLTIAVSALFGFELKRAALIAVIFMVAHTAVSFGFAAMLA